MSDTSAGPPVSPLSTPPAAAAETAPAAAPGETRTERFRRKAHRARLRGYAVATVALLAFLVALATSNTAHVKVNWVFGSSRVALVWLVICAAILGGLLGILVAASSRWRTRAPRR